MVLSGIAVPPEGARALRTDAALYGATVLEYAHASGDWGRDGGLGSRHVLGSLRPEGPAPFAVRQRSDEQLLPCVELHAFVVSEDRRSPAGLTTAS
jgi:hypothetical protein